MKRSQINSGTYDERDREILDRLAAAKQCQYRIVTDGGRHYIFCGAYNKQPAKLVDKSWLCKLHQR